MWSMKYLLSGLLPAATAPALVFVFVFAFAFPVPGHTENTDSAYKAKCAACHGADGRGSAIGNKLGVRDFHDPEVQKQSDAELAEAIAKGRNKMPGYEHSLKPDDIKSLVAYIRELEKK
jgi:mono/diheme cytochrome c family protein